MTSEESPLGSRDFTNEFTFQASRSSGAGGQHVNKVSSRVELRFSIPDSQILTEKEKDTLLRKLKSKLTKEGELLIVSEESRSQHRNKQASIEKFYSMVNQALIPPKKRIPTKPTNAARRKRLEEKRTIAEKKARRKPPED